MATLEQQLEAAKAKATEADKRVKQLKALQAKKEAAAKREAAQQARKLEDRKKLLVGVAMLAEYGDWDSVIAALGPVLDRQLTRPDERALFSLPLPESGTGTTGTAGA